MQAGMAVSRSVAAGRRGYCYCVMLTQPAVSRGWSCGMEGQHGTARHGVAWLDLVGDGVELEGEREALVRPERAEACSGQKAAHWSLISPWQILPLPSP